MAHRVAGAPPGRWPAGSPAAGHPTGISMDALTDIDTYVSYARMLPVPEPGLDEDYVDEVVLSMAHNVTIPPFECKHDPPICPTPTQEACTNNAHFRLRNNASGPRTWLTGLVLHRFWLQA